MGMVLKSFLLLKKKRKLKTLEAVKLKIEIYRMIAGSSKTPVEVIHLTRLTRGEKKRQNYHYQK